MNVTERSVFSLHTPAWSVCSILLCAVFIIIVAPVHVHAVDEQADEQCPAGGAVGQSCKDNTNGYNTTGHCTHIQECSADNWPKEPKNNCSGGNISPACPKESPIASSSYSANTSYSSYATENVFDESSSTLFANLVSQVLAEYVPDAQPQKPTIVGSTSIAGIEYFISNTNESLRVGAPLTPVPKPVALKLGNSYSLNDVTSVDSRARVEAMYEQERLRASAAFVGSSSANAAIGGPASFGSGDSPNVMQPSISQQHTDNSFTDTHGDVTMQSSPDVYPNFWSWLVAQIMLFIHTILKSL